MATLAPTNSATGWAESGSNTENQIGCSALTMPVNGIITDVVFYAKGYTGSVVAQGCVWSTSGTLLGAGGACTLPSAGGSGGINAQQWNDSGGINLYLTSGTQIGVGWWRQPGGSCVWSNQSGTGYYGSNTAAAPTTFSATSLGSNTQPLVFVIYTPATAPTVATSAATNITATSAVLNGTVNPNGAGTWGMFVWGNTAAKAVNGASGASYLGGAVSAAGEVMGNGTNPLLLSMTLSGLSPGTEYYFSIYANQASDSNPEAGSVLNFTTLATAPYAPTTLAPASGTIDRTISETLSWSAFSSPIGGDTQASYTLRWAVQSSSPSWNTIGPVSSTAAFDTLAANTLSANPIQWQVQVTGTAGYTSAWSALAYFVAGTPPSAPSITNPTVGGVIPTSTYTVDWVAPGSQTNYEVRTVADSSGSPNPSIIYQDTGVLAGTGGTQAMSFVTNGQVEHVQVRVMVNGLWSPYGDSGAVTVTYSAPGVPTLVLTPSASTGSISVAITNPAASGGTTTTVSNDLYRFVTSAGSTTAYRVATGLALDATWIDYGPASGTDYQYQAIAFDSNGNSTASAWQD